MRDERKVDASHVVNLHVKPEGESDAAETILPDQVIGTFVHEYERRTTARADEALVLPEVQAPEAAPEEMKSRTRRRMDGTLEEPSKRGEANETRCHHSQR